MRWRRRRRRRRRGRAKHWHCCRAAPFCLCFLSLLVRVCRCVLCGVRVMKEMNEFVRSTTRQGKKAQTHGQGILKQHQDAQVSQHWLYITAGHQDSGTSKSRLVRSGVLRLARKASVARAPPRFIRLLDWLVACCIYLTKSPWSIPLLQPPSRQASPREAYCAGGGGRGGSGS